MGVRRVPSEEWETIRAARLQALRDSPHAFASSHAEEVIRPDDWWIEGAHRLAWFVAEEDGMIVGLVAGMPLGDTPEIISMWVEPGHRGTGVAEDLVGAVVAWAKTEGARGLCLAVAQDNDRARRFYERVGFVPTGDGPTLRSRPDVCTTEMRLSL